MTFDLGPFGHHSTTSAILLVIGAITVLNILFQITRVVLSIFILPGTPVRVSFANVLLLVLTAILSCDHSVQKVHGRLLQVPVMVLASSMLCS